MTIKKLLLTLTLFISLLLFGCSNDTNVKDVIASEKTLPSNFHETAFERETTPFFHFLVKKAINQLEFEQTWNLYGFESETPNVDLNEKDVFFIGVQESGSCPSKIKSVELSSDNNTMTLPLSELEGACTSDATPRTFVIQIDKGISKDIENIVIVQSGVETNVPFEN